MDLILTDEQSLLRDSAATFAGRRGGAARLRELRGAESKIDRARWREAADAGWLAILADEDAGGLGLGLTEMCLVAQELGKGLVPEPVAAAAAVARALGAGDIATGALSGERLVLPALMEGARTVGDEPPALTAEETGGGAMTVDGVKTGVAGAADADGYLISGMAAEGLVLMYAEREAAEILSADLVDGSAAGTLTFATTGAVLVAGANEAPAALAGLLDALYLSTAAELLGVMEKAHEITVEYLKVREQFGRPIGSFQALQHRAVDNLAAIEMSRSLIYQAASALDAGGGAPGLASAALSRASKSALDVAKSAIQMHGGIGFTDEHDIGLYLKRAMALSSRYGNAGLHRKRYAEFAELHD